MTTAATRLTWPEIRARAVAFARDWAAAASERAEAQTFWNEFLAVFGVHRRRAGTKADRMHVMGSIPDSFGNAALAARGEVSRC